MSNTIKITMDSQNKTIRLDEKGKALPAPYETIRYLNEQTDAANKAFTALRDAMYESSRAQDAVTELFNDDNVDQSNKNLAWSIAENHVRQIQSIAERTTRLANQTASNLALRTAREFWNKRS